MWSVDSGEGSFPQAGGNGGGPFSWDTPGDLCTSIVFTIWTRLTVEKLALHDSNFSLTPSPHNSSLSFGSQADCFARRVPRPSQRSSSTSKSFKTSTLASTSSRSSSKGLLTTPSRSVMCKPFIRSLPHPSLLLTLLNPNTGQVSALSTLTALRDACTQQNLHQRSASCSVQIIMALLLAVNKTTMGLLRLVSRVARRTRFTLGRS